MVLELNGQKRQDFLLLVAVFSHQDAATMAFWSQTGKIRRDVDEASFDVSQQVGNVSLLPIDLSEANQVPMQLPFQAQIVAIAQ